MRIACFLATAVCLMELGALGADAAAPPKVGLSAEALAKVGDVIFAADFSGTDALAGWTRAGNAKIDTSAPGGHAVMIECTPEMPSRGANIQRPLPVERLRGCKLIFSARVKAENVSAKPNPWNGIKFMAPIVAPGGKQWHQGEIGTGTFDWRPVAWQAAVPADATEVSLVLGLEQVTGKVWFEDVKVVVRRPPVVAQPRASEGPPYKGHNLPRLRGAMISPNIDEDGLRTFGRDWNANLIRWQLIHTRGGLPVTTLAEYDAWLENELKKLDAALPLCEKYGLYVVVDIHSPPGGKPTTSGYVGSDDRFFSDKACQDKFIEVWQKMARRYRGAKAVWGYDLANEPVENTFGEGCDDWQALAERAAKAIREIDPERAIIVEPAAWGGPGGLDELQPINVPNVVYSVHMYIPHAFTHQGVFDDGKKQYVYPGTIEGKRWDRAALEAALKPAVDFQKKYGVHIYIGEFSAIRWAPDQSACRYLKDVIDIFESHGWDWSYHAFREWDGWSVEHGSDRASRARAAEPTDREKLLREWFAKNQKPAWSLPAAPPQGKDSK